MIRTSPPHRFLLSVAVTATVLSPAFSQDIRFREGAKAAGIEFRHVSGSPEKELIIESMSGGVAVFDYDSDGWMDLYLINGGIVEELVAGKRTVRNALYRNKGGGGFEDVTEQAGVPGGLWDMGAVSADIDNDGHPDLLVTGFARLTLYRNLGNGKFQDISSSSGLDGSGWSTGAAFADYNRDGLLDLSVVRYVEFDPAHPPERGPHCSYRGIDVQCGPRGLPGEDDSLYLNLGGGRFKDVSQESGIRTGNRYYGLGTLWTDADDDGDLDLFVANDSCPNFLFRNENGRFTEIAMEAGVGLNEDGREQAGMGVESADANGDGRLDLFQTNFSDDKNTLYLNQGAYFLDSSYALGLGEISWQFLGWGAVFLDADLDGWFDLFVSNGHVYPQVDRFQIGTRYHQRDFLFHNQQGRIFKEIGEQAGITGVFNSRGAASGDFNNDGRVDLIVNHQDESPALFWNETQVDGRTWIGLDLITRGRTAVGARATVYYSGGARSREIQAGSSYLSSNDPRLVIGLGGQKPDRIKIRWPDGAEQEITDLETNRYHRVEQPNSTP